MNLVQKWNSRGGALKDEVYALAVAVKDPRTPWLARVATGIVVAYVFSPIDIIPDFIPFAGWLDDLLIVNLGVWFVLKLIPGEVMDNARLKSEPVKNHIRKIKRYFWIAIGLIALFWVIVLGLILYGLMRLAK